MSRERRPPRTNPIPEWGGWAVAAIGGAIQFADRAGIANLWGALAVVLAVAGCVVSVRWPRAAAVAVVGAMLLNAAFPANALIAAYVGLIWLPIVVGASGGARTLGVVLAAGLLAAILLEVASGATTAPEIAVRAAILAIVLGAPGMAGLLMGRYWGRARQAEIARQRDAELLRRALSRDLHDTAVHATTSMVMRANQALLRTDLDEQSRRDLQFIADTGRDATRSLRATLASLRNTDAISVPPSADGAWFRARLAGEQARLEAAGFVVRATTEASLAEVDGQSLSALGGIMTEVANNVIRHGLAGSEVALMVEKDGDSITLMCSNVLASETQDGEPDRPRLGLTGITELAEAHGGRVSAQALGAHWVTHVSLPVDGKRPDAKRDRDGLV